MDWHRHPVLSILALEPNIIHFREVELAPFSHVESAIYLVSFS